MTAFRMIRRLQFRNAENRWIGGANDDQRAPIWLQQQRVRFPRQLMVVIRAIVGFDT